MIELTYAVLVGLTIGLTEVVKRALNNKGSRYMPLVSIILALGLTVLVGEGTTQEIVLSGVMIGLSASGLWSGTKSVAGR